MKKTIQIFAVFFLLFGLFACKSEFEKVRTSSDPKLLLEKANEYFEQEEYQKSQTLYELIIPSYRGRAELEDIYYKYAYTYYHLGQFSLAALYFGNFIETFSTSTYREELAFMSAYANYKMSPTFRLDQTFTASAIDEMQAFIDRYPSSDRVEEANQLIDEMRLKLEKKAVDQGRLYYDLKEYQSAIQALENALKDFPETKQGDYIRSLIVFSAFKLAENSVITKQRERYEKAKETSDLFLKKYPKSKYWNEVNAINKRAIQQLKSISRDDRYQVQSSIN